MRHLDRCERIKVVGINFIGTGDRNGGGIRFRPVSIVFPENNGAFYRDRTCPFSVRFAKVPRVEGQ